MWSRPSFIDFLPDHTVQSNVADIEGQMALFDRLIVPDRTAKVVDLAPASFQQFFSVMAQIDFVDQARRRGIEPVALFMAAPDAVSQRAYAELQRGLPELLLVPVYNEAIAQGKRARQNFPPGRLVSVPIQIPALAPHFYRYLENPPFSFAEFRGTPPRRHPARLLYGAAALGAARFCRISRTRAAALARRGAGLALSRRFVN